MDHKRIFKERAEGHAYYSGGDCAQYDKSEHCPDLGVLTLNSFT
jgi:hypothetical protein